jgi:hypothetical protein
VKRRIWFIDGDKRRMRSCTARVDDANGIAIGRDRHGEGVIFSPGEYSTDSKATALKKAKIGIHKQADDLRAQAAALDKLADDLR